MLRRYEFGEIEVSERGQGTLYCTDCGTTVTRYQEDKLFKGDGTTCPTCNDGLYFDTFEARVGVRVRNDCARYLVDTPREWWHGTSRENWRPPEDLFVHVGTKYAANQVVRSNPFDRKHFYRVRLKPHVQYAPGFYHDDNSWPSNGGDSFSQSAYNVKPLDGIAFRYINKAESPGSISVLVQFGDLDILRHVDAVGEPVLGSL